MLKPLSERYETSSGGNTTLSDPRGPLAES
jgi:hypothetical protein